MLKGEADLEAGVARRRCDRQVAVVPTDDDAIADVEPETRSLAYFLGRDEVHRRSRAGPLALPEDRHNLRKPVLLVRDRLVQDAVGCQAILATKLFCHSSQNIGALFYLCEIGPLNHCVRTLATRAKDHSWNTGGR